MSYNEFDNAHWNSFIGKKILLINPGAKSIEVAVVTGCDPDIGICLNEVGVVKPHTIFLGPGAPNYTNGANKTTEEQKEYLLSSFKQIQSGYFSYPINDVCSRNFFGYDGSNTFPISCPYSM